MEEYKIVPYGDIGPLSSFLYLHTHTYLIIQWRLLNIRFLFFFQNLKKSLGISVMLNCFQ